MIKAPAIVLCGIFAFYGACASAAEAPATSQSPADARQTKEEKAVQAYGDDNATCREWTDGCVICIKGAGNAASCSLPGIACQPHAVQCTAQAEAPAAKQ